MDNISGILLYNKEQDLTSNKALQRIKRLFKAKKAGHTGSLDPLATGMLPICFGEATKLSQYLLESDKYYRVTAKLGIRTNTGDAEGEVIATHNEINLSPLNTILQNFTGTQDQVPPMYSAIKFQGQPLYKLARKGIEIERKSRTITIHQLNLLNTRSDEIEFDVHCTKGTYIRTLVDDIGLALGCGAHVSKLHRTAVAPYEAANMYTLEELEDKLSKEGLSGMRNCLLPLDSAINFLPKVILSTAATFYIKTGQPVMASQVRHQGLVRLVSDNDAFLGIGEMTDDGRVAPKRLFAEAQKTA